MKRWRAEFRIFIYAAISFLPALATNWWLIILPSVLEHDFNITDEKEKLDWAGTIFITGYVGIFFGAFIWPKMITLLEKKTCITLGITLMSFTVGCAGIGGKIWVFAVCRVCQGLVMNIHTVGKDFIFDYFEDELRQTILTYSTISALVGNLVGPLIGVFIYRQTGDNFALSCVYVMCVFIFVIAFYLIFYYAMPFKPLELKIDVEERMRLIRKRRSSDMIYGGDYKKAFLKAIQRPILRNIMITYILSNACTSAELLISILFLLTTMAKGGFGVSQTKLSFVYSISIVPCLVVMLGWNKLVPKRLSYKWAILLLIIIFCVAVMLTPLFRDLITASNYPWLINLVLLNQSVKSFTNSHSYSPIIYYFFNKKLNKHIRTGVNSIFYIFSVSWVIIFVKISVYVYRETMLEPYFVSWAPFNKYIVFIFITVLQLIPLFLLWNIEKKPAEGAKMTQEQIAGMEKKDQVGVRKRKASEQFAAKGQAPKIKGIMRDSKKEIYYGHVTFKNEEAALGKNASEKKDLKESPF